MNTDLMTRVRSLRGQNRFHPIPIATAVQIARYETTEPTGPWAFLAEIENGSCTVTGELGPVTITVVIETDDEPSEDDVTGEFTDRKSETTVPNTRNDWHIKTKYYEPSTVRLAETPADYSALGMSRAVAREAMRAAIDADMAADASRYSYGVIVTVSVDGEELGNASVWGIDTIDGYDGRAYFIETARDLTGEAIDQARDRGPQAAEQARAHAAKLEAARPWFTEQG